MSDVALRLATAATLLWLGMVLAISFLEAPLKFRAPGLDLRVGLGIGRIVFRALNAAEVGWAGLLAICLVLGEPSGTVAVLAILAGALLAGQLALVRPRLNRRSDAVLAGPPGAPHGQGAARSHAHHVYIGLEVLKVALLVALSWALLAA